MSQLIHEQDKLVVVKIGGSKLCKEDDLKFLGTYVKGLLTAKNKVVVVHGGGPEISSLHERLDIPFAKRNGLRATIGESIDATTMVLCGLVNKRVVAAFAARDIPAIGISGADAGLLRADFLDSKLLGRVGAPPRVDVAKFRDLISLPWVPVLAPISLGPDFGLINVNADNAAHAIATAMNATCLDFLSDIPGVKDLEGKVIPSLNAKQALNLIESKIIHGGMVPKIESALEAVRRGVHRVRIGDLTSMMNATATLIGV